MTNTIVQNTLEKIPEMNLFTLRCYVKERTEICLKDEEKLEIWEECIKKMLRISDYLIRSKNYNGGYNDEFHFLWETMMLSLEITDIRKTEIGEIDVKKPTNIFLRDFYNCGCNGNEKNTWDDIV